MYNKKKEGILKKLYETTSFNTSFSSQNKLYKEARKIYPLIDLKDVKHFLQKQDSYTLFKLSKKKFQTRKIIAAAPKIIISLDLMDMSKLSRYNNGFKFLMYFIDVFSRKITVIPIKNKKKGTILEGLQSFFNINDNYKYSRIYSDREGSLYSNLIQKYLMDNKIILYSNTSYERKNAIAEVGIKNIKQKIYKYLTHFSVNKYIDVLPDIVESLNNSSHSSLKYKFLTPNILHNIKQVNFIKEQFHRMYDINIGKYGDKEQSMSVGDYVRIPKLSRTQSVFFKGYSISNTEEIFRIDSINKSMFPYVYNLTDLSGEKIHGSFYIEELTKVKLKSIYPIKVLKQKYIKGKKVFLVSFLGYPSSFDSWIPEKNLVNYEKNI